MNAPPISVTRQQPVVPSRLDSIEAARGLAALAVALMHVASLMNVPNFAGHVGMGGLFNFGYVGVDFFFVLSGFIITYVHHHELGKPSALPRYLWRRFSRIFPIYWFVLLLTISLGAVARLAAGQAPTLELGAADIPGTIFLLISFSGALVEPKYIGVAWTLQLEVLFYIAFCIVMLHRRVGLSLLAMWFLYLLAHVAGLIQAELPWHLGSAHCLQFLMGVSVALLARAGSLPASRGNFYCALLALASGIAFEIQGPLGLHSAYGRIALGLGSAWVLAALVGLEQGAARRPTNENAPKQGPLRCPAWLVKFGAASYSVYLAHILLASLTYTVLLRIGVYHLLPESVTYTIALAAALGGTLVIGYWVELPVVKWLKAKTPQTKS
ncbi:MAG: hypothetical protein RJB26_2500 [Pseudomonadota bacterium]